MTGAEHIGPSGRLLIEPGQAHGTDLQAWRQCAAGLVRAFVQHANARDLDASCRTRVALPPFPLRSQMP